MKYLKLDIKLLNLIFLIAVVTPALSQSVDRKVISTQGGQIEKEGITLSWTIGQGGLVGTSSSNTIILNSGFEQENDQLFVASIEVNAHHFEISVFPNPVSNEIHLNTSSKIPATCNYSILDLNGKCLLEKQNVAVMAGKNNEIINLAFLVPGSYFLQIQLISSNKSTELSTIKIVKH